MLSVLGTVFEPDGCVRIIYGGVVCQMLQADKNSIRYISDKVVLDERSRLGEGGAKRRYRPGPASDRGSPSLLIPRRIAPTRPAQMKRPGQAQERDQDQYGRGGVPAKKQGQNHQNYNTQP